MIEIDSDNEQQHEQVQKEKLDYWKQKLKDLSPLQLPTDFSRPQVPSTLGKKLIFTINPQLTAQLNTLIQNQHTTLFITLLAVFKVLLYRYSGQEDICVGTLITGSEGEVAEEQQGFFINALALRTLFRSNIPFIELLKRVKDTTLEAYENQDVLIEQVVESLGLENKKSNNPVFSVMFFQQNLTESQFTEGEPTIEEFENVTTFFDLTFEITETAAGIRVVVEYSIDVFKQETVECLIAHYKQLVESVLAVPFDPVGKLNLLSDSEQQLLHSFNATQVSRPKGKTIISLFEEQAKKNPDAVAVIFEETQLTYFELDKKANQLSHYLRNKGVKEESLVPICTERSLEMIIGIIGILKAGAAYVPIDPAFPNERIDYMLADINSPWIVCSYDTSSKFPVSKTLIHLETEAIHQQSSEKLPIAQKIHHLVYVIYTSGSTGKPKGVMIEHHSLLNFILSISKEVGFKSTSSLLSVTTYSFDIFNLDLFLPLINGGELIVVSRQKAMDARILLGLIRNYEEPVMQATPVTWRMLLNSGWDEPMALKVLCCGEVLPDDLARRLYRLVGSFWNGYGPTETTIYSTTKKIEENERVTIGKPIDNTSIYIFNKDNQLNPIGVVGELCIAGEGVGRGYLNRHELSQEKFAANPFGTQKDERIYRSGDLARWLPDGNIEYLGRMDNQVKIRGYRIELGEIETALNGINGVRESAVVLREDVPRDQRLVGYVVCEPIFSSLPQQERLTILRKTLRMQLPEYMMPADWVFLDSLPLTTSNKIDRKSLPIPSDDSKINALNPHTENEKLVSMIWCRYLKKKALDLQDDFFEIGGNSLLAVNVLIELEKATGLNLPLNAIYKNPTISGLAEYIKNDKLNEEHWDSLVPIKPKGKKPPLYLIHGEGPTVSIFYRFAGLLDDDQPVYGFQAKGINGKDVPHASVEEMAAYYISLLVAQDPKGPYRLAGYCFGGYVAYEMARQLLVMGKKVDKLILFDTAAFEDWKRLSGFKKIKLKVGRRVTDFMFFFKEPNAFMGLKLRSLRKKKVRILERLHIKPKLDTQTDNNSRVTRLTRNNIRILKKYNLSFYKGDIYLVKVKNRRFYVEDPEFYGWVPLVNHITVIDVPGHHENIFHKGEIVTEMAEKIQNVLNENAYF